MNPRQTLEQARREGRTVLDEVRAKHIIAAFGVRVPRGVVIRAADQIGASVGGIGFPVAAKLVSPDISHKSDIGGVRLQLASAAAVGAAFAALQRTARDHGLRFDGVLVEEMAPPGPELVVGGVIDRRFGPVLMLGSGGIFIEVFRDVTFRICPVERRDAAEMIDELRAVAILRGARGRPAVSEAAIVEVLLAIGGADGLLLQLEDVVGELDINPLIASADGAIACDARLVLAKEIHGAPPA